MRIAKGWLGHRYAVLATLLGSGPLPGVQTWTIEIKGAEISLDPPMARPLQLEKKHKACINRCPNGCIPYRW